MDMAGRMEAELKSLDSDTYSIAVAGEFKTGKSTLINRIFLKKDLLFTDIMEATAVPVEICFGTEKCLEIYPAASFSPADSDWTGLNSLSKPDSSGSDCSARSVLRIPDPDPETIKIHTSAENPEDRARLAEKTAKVKLHWPASNLEGLRIFDTPGINSLNAAVIAAACRILPQADLVLFMIGAKQLSHTEKEFLSSRLFREGITRCMMIVSYDSAGESSASEREQLAESIRRQLAHMGNENIPVEFFDIRDKGPEQSSESIRQRIDREIPLSEKKSGALAANDADDVIAQLLGHKKRPEPIAASAIPASGISVLEQKIIAFIRDNVRPGRREKTAHVMENQMRLALFRCQAELAAFRKSEAERRQMSTEIRAQEAEIRLRHEILTREFRQDLEAVRYALIRDAQAGIRQIADNWTAGFEACEGLPEIRSRLKNAGDFLKKHTEEMLLICSRKAGEELAGLIRRYGMKTQVLFHPWQSDISRKMEIDGGILAKIPPFAVLAFDLMLFARFGPFGPIADILIRVLVHYIPLINQALPVSIAGSLLKKKIRSSLHTCFEQITDDLPEQIGKSFDPLIQNLLAQWQEYAEMQLKTVRDSAGHVTDQPLDTNRQIFLYDMQQKLELLLAGKSET